MRALRTSLPLGILAALLLAPIAQAGGDPEKGAQVFRKCQACHRVGPGATALVGPPLNGIIGRKAASIEGYSYSPAMRQSAVIWDAGTLSQYLKAPKDFIPNVYMNFPGLKKDEDIANVIAYLSQFDADGNIKAPSQ